MFNTCSVFLSFCFHFPVVLLSQHSFLFVPSVHLLLLIFCDYSHHPLLRVNRAFTRSEHSWGVREVAGCHFLPYMYRYINSVYSIFFPVLFSNMLAAFLVKAIPFFACLLDSGLLSDLMHFFLLPKSNVK